MLRFSTNCALTFCHLGPCGLASSAPGTIGSFLAACLAPFLFLPLNFWQRGLVLIILFILGGIAATEAEKIYGYKDPGPVVIDELVGLWIALLPFARPGFWHLILAFIFFRIFDIAKPWPVRASETWLPAGFGIMIDDVLAGIWALILLLLLQLTGLL